MNKVKNKIFSVVMLILALLWCVIVLAFVDHSNAGFYYWGGFGFGLAAFLISAGVYWFVNYRSDQNTAEITMIPGFVSSIYIVFCAVFNLIFIYQKDGEYGEIIVAVNVLVLLAYLIAIFYLTIYASRVVTQAKRINDKTEQLSMIKTELAAALGMCKDADIKQGLLELKQKVDYSDNLSQGIAEQEENQFCAQIKEIEQCLNNQDSKEMILSKIAEAERIWLIRNSKLTTKR